MKKMYALFALFIAMGMILPTTAFAAEETVTTTLYLNVAALLSFEVTLLGEAAVTSAGGGTPTSSNIEFNCSDGTTANMQAQVTGGGSTQMAGNPILNVSNVGTVNIEPLNITLSADVPACWTLYYDSAFQVTCSNSGYTVNSTSEITVDSSMIPDEYHPIYLCSDSSGCSSSDSTTRTFTVEGTGV